MSQLTKKEQGRVVAALNQSQVGLFDTNEKTLAMSGQLFETMDRCTNDIKRVLDVFLCNSSIKARSKKMFSNIDSQGLNNISQMCSELGNNPNALDGVSIRTVFGGTEEMPFRALVYLLPAIDLCERLKMVKPDANLNIEYLFMSGAGVQFNAMDEKKASNATSRFIRIANEYIKEFHPAISDFVNFYVDRSFSKDIIATPEYCEAVNALDERINANLKGDLLEMGRRRNHAINSIKYATLHAFSQDGYIDPNVATMTNFFGGDTIRESDMIISIGAKPEETFFRARKEMVDAMKQVSFFVPKKTAQYIANINVPPYSPLPEGELYLDDVLKNVGLLEKARARDARSEEYSDYQTPVQKAVETLIEDIYYSDSDMSLSDFMKNMREKEIAHETIEI